MPAKELMRPWEVAGLYEDERFSSPFVIKEPEPAWSAKKRGGVEGKREGSFNINVPLCLEYTLAPIPLLFSFHSAPRCMPRRPKKVQHSKQQLELLCGP